MTAIETEKVIYNLPNLLAHFTEALTKKTAQVATYGGAPWTKEWPGGNTKHEQLVVDWLEAQKKDGLTRIETKHPLTGVDVNHSLYMQIHNNLAKGIK